jgi:hypothetical protein
MPVVPATTLAPMTGYGRVVGAICRDRAWPEPVCEYLFHPMRQWRFDLAWPQHWLAVEIQGGLFTQGAHVRPANLKAREYPKLNEAQILGWVVLLVLPEDITNGGLSALLERYFLRLWPDRFAKKVKSP